MGSGSVTWLVKNKGEHLLCKLEIVNHFPMSPFCCPILKTNADQGLG